MKNHGGAVTVTDPDAAMVEQDCKALGPGKSVGASRNVPEGNAPLLLITSR
jgi:hypothetical protein